MALEVLLGFTIRLLYTNGSLFGKRDLLAIFHVMKYDVKCGMCLHKFDCRETTFSNAANHFKIFLIEIEICLYKHLYFLYIRNPLFPNCCLYFHVMAAFKS